MNLTDRITHFAVTRFNSSLAKSNSDFCNTVMNLVPEDMKIPLLVLSVRIHPFADTLPEVNECAKIFYILSGEGQMQIDNQQITLKDGETIWLPKGSVHTIKTGENELKLLVIK